MVGLLVDQNGPFSIHQWLIFDSFSKETCAVFVSDSVFICNFPKAILRSRSRDSGPGLFFRFVVQGRGVLALGGYKAELLQGAQCEEGGKK